MPLPPVALPGLAALFEGSLWPSLSRQHDGLFPLHDPGRQVRTLEAGLDQWMVQVRPLVAPEREAVCVILHPDADTSTRFFEMAAARLGSSTGLLHDPSRAAVALVFPHDPTLLALATLADRNAPRLLRENALGRRDGPPPTLRILRWHPGQRALVVLDGQSPGEPGIGLEAFPLDRIDSVLQSQEQVARLAEAGAPFRTPRAYTSTDFRNLWIREWLAEPTWEERLAEAPLDTEDARMAGHALAYLHASSLEVDHHPSPPEQAEEVLALGQVIAGLLPDEASRVQALAEQVAENLCQLNLSPSSVVLGLLPARCILTHQRRPVWLGARHTSRGAAALDLGHLSFDLERHGATTTFRDFLDGYRETRGESPPPQWLEGVRAMHLFRGLIEPLHATRPDWPAQLRWRLDAASHGTARVAT